MVFVVMLGVLHGKINFDFEWCAPLRNFPGVPITDTEGGTC